MGRRGASSSPISTSSIRELTGLWMGWRPCGLGAITTAISHPADPLICCRDEKEAPRAPEAPDEVLTSLSRTHGIKKILLLLKVKTAAQVSRQTNWKVLLRDEKCDLIKKWLWSQWGRGVESYSGNTLKSNMSHVLETATTEYKKHSCNIFCQLFCQVSTCLPFKGVICDRWTKCFWISLSKLRIYVDQTRGESRRKVHHVHLNCSGVQR